VLAKEKLDSDIGALFVESVNDVIKANRTRIAVSVHYRIPIDVQLWLLFLTSIAMIALGFQFGLSGHNNILIYLILAISFSAVELLIVRLDRLGPDTVQINQQPMLDLQKKLNNVTP